MTDLTPERLAELRAVAESQAAAHERMLELNGGVGMLGVRYPEMFEDMLRWGDSTENEHADTVLALIAALEAKTAEVDAKADYVSDLEERVRQRDNHVIPVLHARIKEAERERDEARELYKGACEAEDALNSVNDALINRAYKAEAALERIKGARANYPECDKYDDDSPITCGWKRTVQSIDAALQTIQGADDA